MQAVVKQEIGDGFVGLAEVPEPEPSSGKVIVRVGAAGICGSDLMILHNRFPGYKVPVVLGHEFAGTIESVGPGVDGLSQGDRVACETHAYVCNDCVYCRTGVYNLCPRRKGFGYGVDGAFARLVSVRERIVHRLPEELSIEQGAVLEPLSVALNALTRNSRLVPGETVLIIGPGPIGLLSLEVAKLSRATVTVSGTESSRRRLSLASKLGADRTITDTELEYGLTRGDLNAFFDTVVIAVGSPSAFETALRAARPGGKVVHIGESTDRASFQFSMVERKNLTIVGSFSHNWPIWEQAISLVKRRDIDVKSLVTHKVRIADWRQAFDLVETRAGVKVLIEP